MQPITASLKAEIYRPNQFSRLGRYEGIQIEWHFYIYIRLKYGINRDNIVGRVQMSAVGGIVLPENLDERF